MGVSAGFHDAGVSVVNNRGDILFAAHSERYSKIKNDPNLCDGIMEMALRLGEPHTIAWYERPWLKKTRQLYSGEWRKVFTDKSPRQHLSPYFPDLLPSSHDVDGNTVRNIQYYGHHLSHAAAGFQTSPFDDAIVVVVDAIGEWDTWSAFYASYDERGHATYKRLYRQIYPHSLGLFYSAMTDRVGLKPMEEEYILMGMAAYGKKDAYRDVWEMAVDQDYKQKFKRNFHTGIEYEFGAQYGMETLANATQMVTERVLVTFMRQLAIKYPHVQDCVFMGGVALNCVANSLIRDIWNRLWIMPNPGDCGSSLGAAALAYGKKLNWEGPYLGSNVSTNPYPSEEIIGEIQTTGICGVASGRAEFGPRALGNRSLLADPRGPDIKDKVNEIKRRQKFRPFAPMVLEEHAHDYFEMPKFDTSPYMQFTYKCKRPDLFPAIVHHDGTSRVQTVGCNDKTGARDLLEKWYVLTDCPMLLNTSLNIRGEPMVDNRDDADRFEKQYGVRVCS